MLEWVEINQWNDRLSQDVKTTAIQSLEQGKVLYFPQLAFNFQEGEKQFLTPQCSDGKSKNVGFDAMQKRLWGTHCRGEAYQQLYHLLARYSQYAQELITALFPSYSSALILGRTSYRPVAITGRISSYRKDDTRLHVDAFPATPLQGWRILRIFTNVNPHGENRVWRLGEPFERVAESFLPRTRRPLWGSRKLLHALRITKKCRTLYDHLMLQIHDGMKADLAYQANAQQQTVHFPPNSSWIVQTDQVSHAAMSGQYVMEQTFYLPVNAMMNIEKSPLRVLEKMMGRVLV